MKQLPSSCAAYKKTPVFDQDTVPQGLLNSHQTKAGTWGKIVILSGRLRYTILEPETEEHMLDESNYGVVEPCVLHQVEPQGSVSFYVEFYR